MAHGNKPSMGIIPMEEAEGNSRSISLGDQGGLCFSVPIFDLMHQGFPGGSTIKRYLLFNHHLFQMQWM
jgi:hypothetical protein